MTDREVDPFPRMLELTSTPNRYHSLSSDRVLFETASGLHGAAPLHAMIGDHVFLFPQAKTPFILRKWSDEAGIHQLVGDCYLHGAMEGQLADEARKCELTITIV